ncbi:uncharacterized protein LOC131301036 isoform X1 [Rhododendron vialii]|uniref:uncharacterized protein LOC131301036 isoform X1 n=1 Tax=Rhododendron vialii TaxID=182163 RepID=UPI00266025B6|nr:uncharacterized protein LOC131301036 isoform X1 [Rhododendron vialii]
MAKPDEEKSDGLEIISIGKLYSGPWDKKYWSSSRGKDRYPYPVGYKAVRTHNGMTCKMEIHEGLKGPLFSIVSDGPPCSGQTPDIAWESFQKKGCPRLKLWHGKRYSCNIEGIEFFGFKNPFVQRLLRELVANVDGTAEQSFLPSSCSNGDLGTKHHSQSTESCTSPDDQLHSAKPQIKGKRSRRGKPTTFNSTCEASFKKLRPKDQNLQMHNNDDTTNSRQGFQNYLNGRTSILYPDSNQEHDGSNDPEAMEASTSLETAVQRENDLVNDSLPLESSQHFGHLGKELPPHKESNHVSSENCISTGIAGNLSPLDQHLDRSKDAEIQMLCSSMLSKDKDGEVPIPKDTQNVSDMDLCAPDSLDPLQDTTSDPQPNRLKKSPCNARSELTSEKLVVSESPAPELHPLEEMGTLTASSEKSDFDSVDQDIANSMMTFLLPRALPLLKTFSRKKKKIKNGSENSPCWEQNQKKANRTDYHADLPPPAEAHTQSPLLDQKEKQKMQILNAEPGLVVPSFELYPPVVHDSVKNGKSGSDAAEAGVAALGESIPRSDDSGLPVNVDTSAQSLIGHAGGSDSNDIFTFNKAPMSSIGRPKNGDNLIPESTLGCMLSSEHVILASNKDICRHSDEKVMHCDIHSKEKDLNESPSCVKGTVDDNSTSVARSVQVSHGEIIFKEGEADTSNTSFTHIQNEASTRKHNGPLTESIIFRNVNDGYGPNMYTATNLLLASDIQPASPFNSNPHTSYSSGVDAINDGQTNSLHVQKFTNNFNGRLHNVAAVLQSQSFMGPSSFATNLEVINQTSSCNEKSLAEVDKELQRRQNIVDMSNPVSRFHKQGRDICVNNSEVADDSRLKLPMDMGDNDKMEKIIDLVGCYIHPLPISLVLLSTKEKEIYICVLCGVSADKRRTLFVYKVSLEQQSLGCPSFIGHTQILLPTSKDAFGREITLERSGLQFTPDGQCLVLLKSMKAPHCREGKLQCPCSGCRSECFENYAVKVVQVKHGYISVVATLKTVDDVHCLLVCEPNYVVGVEESGKLHLWIMNSTWSAQIEECDLSTSDCIFPCIVELKRVPHCAALVVGHNGFGEFGLWDISTRTFVARFSSPSTSVCQFLPIALFRWQSKAHGHINDLAAARKALFLEQCGNHMSTPIDGEDVAVWLFISTVCKNDVQQDFQSTDRKTNPVGFWRLALLVKNRVILGSALDSRAAAIGASAGHGIIGTGDGLVYTWELSTGSKVKDLLCFKGIGVSCIATSNSKSGLLAVAGGDQLRVYLHSQGGLF